MIYTYLYTFLSVAVVSVVSLIGIFTIGINESFLRKVLQYVISFSAGALLGDVFLHVLPEMGQDGFAIKSGLYLLLGIVIFFLLEKYILWHHDHGEHEESVHSTTYLTIFGDALHNFIDGLIIAASFLVSIPLGITTTIAVVFHEIPQEIGQFAILIHGGWSKAKALWYNFVSAVTSVLGAAVVLFLAPQLKDAPMALLSFAAASFIYIAMSDIIPELHKEKNIKKSLWQVFSFVIGVMVMLLLIYLE